MDTIVKQLVKEGVFSLFVPYNKELKLDVYIHLKGQKDQISKSENEIKPLLYFPNPQRLKNCQICKKGVNLFMMPVEVLVKGAKLHLRNRCYVQIPLPGEAPKPSEFKGVKEKKKFLESDKYIQFAMKRVLQIFYAIEEGRCEIKFKFINNEVFMFDIDKIGIKKFEIDNDGKKEKLI